MPLNKASISIPINELVLMPVSNVEACIYWCKTSGMGCFIFTVFLIFKKLGK